MSIEIYEDTMNKISIYKDLEISEQQKKEGKVKHARALLAEMREKYDL